MAIDRDNFTLRHIRDVEDEVLSQYSCGRPQLDDFLREDARAYDAHGLTNTVIVFVEQYSTPVAYFSLTADSVHLSSGERTDCSWLARVSMKSSATCGPPMKNESHVWPSGEMMRSTPRARMSTRFTSTGKRMSAGSRTA